MGQFDVYLSSIGKARGEVTAIAGELVGQKQQLAASLDTFLGSDWSGAAADSFRLAFSDWGEGADQVLEGLQATSRLLEQSRSLYEANDEAVHSDFGRLRDRLG